MRTVFGSFVLFNHFIGSLDAASSQRIAEIVVTASPILPLIDKVDARITKEALERRKQTTLVETLRTSPGLQVVQYGLGRQTAVYMRGANADHAVIRIDGMHVNDPTVANGAYNFAHLLTNGIDQVKISRGSSSTINGDGAIGGVIDIQTQKGSGPSRLSFQGSEGSFDTTTGSFDLQGGQGRANYHISLGHLRSRGFCSVPARYRSDRDQRDPYKNTTLVSRLGVDLSDTVSVSLFTRGLGADSRYSDDFSANPFKREKTLNQHHRLQTDMKLWDGRWQQSLGVSASLFKREDVNARPPFDDVTRYRGNSTQVDWKHTLRLTENHVLSGCLETEESRLKLWDKTIHRQVLAGSLVQSSTFFKRLNIQAGGRLHQPQRLKTIAVYHLATSYHHLETDTVAKGRYGTSFKTPSLYQLYGPDSGNPFLKTETSAGWEGGVEQGFLHHQLCIGSTYFHNDISHLIVFGMAPPFQNINLNGASTCGFESFISFKVRRDLSLRLDHTYTRTKDKTTRRDLLRRPRHKVSLQVDYDATEKWQTSLCVAYTGRWLDIDRKSYRRVYAKPYTTTTLTTSYNLSDTWQCYGKIGNFLNAQYEEPYGYLQPGVTFLAGIKATVL